MPYTPDSYQLPFSGRTPRQRQNSYQAALAQRSTRGVKKLRVLAFIAQVGRATDQGIADGLSLPIQSVCSLRNALCAERLITRVDDVIGKYGVRVSVYGPVQPSACSTPQAPLEAS